MRGAQSRVICKPYRLNVCALLVNVKFNLLKRSLDQEGGYGVNPRFKSLKSHTRRNSDQTLLTNTQIDKPVRIFFSELVKYAIAYISDEDNNAVIPIRQFGDNFTKSPSQVSPSSLLPICKSSPLIFRACQAGSFSKALIPRPLMVWTINTRGRDKLLGFFNAGTN